MRIVSLLSIFFVLAFLQGCKIDADTNTSQTTNNTINQTSIVNKTDKEKGMREQQLRQWRQATNTEGKYENLSSYDKPLP